MELLSVEVRTPKYSDREGFFARSGNGRTYGTGSVYEPKDQESKKQFIKEFSSEIKGLAAERDITSAYVFSPDYAVTELKSELPEEVLSKVRLTFMGNFVKFGPMELLSRISDQLHAAKAKGDLLPPEEAKIMKHPRSTAGRQAKKTRRPS